MKELLAPTADRKTFIGGSDAPSIMGCSPWKSRYQLWLEKTGQAEPDNLEGNEAVYWGTVLEDVVARGYAQKTGRKVHRVNKRLTTVEHGCPMAAQIDRIVTGSGRILEIKTTSSWNAINWGESGTSDIPTHVYCQVQHQMLVSGIKLADVVCLIGGQELRMYSLLADPEYQETLAQMELMFWNQVMSRTPPLPMDSAEAAMRWRDPQPRKIDSTPEDAADVATIREYAYEIKRLEEMKAAVELRLKYRMNNQADEIVGPTGTLATWKTQTRSSLDTKRLQAEHPDLAAQYLRESSFRVFRIRGER